MLFVSFSALLLPLNSLTARDLFLGYGAIENKAGRAKVYFSCDRFTKLRAYKVPIKF
jgi:hypothetical protein